MQARDFPIFGGGSEPPRGPTAEDQHLHLHLPLSSVVSPGASRDLIGPPAKAGVADGGCPFRAGGCWGRVWDLLFGEWNGLKQAGQRRSPVIIVRPGTRGDDGQGWSRRGAVNGVLSHRVKDGATVWRPRLPGAPRDKQLVSAAWPQGLISLSGDFRVAAEGAGHPTPRIPPPCHHTQVPRPAFLLSSRARRAVMG